MSFATTNANQGLLKSTLARLTVARCMTSQMAFLSGTYTYRCAWTQPVAKVTYNGVDMTKDTAIPTVNAHYWHDEDNSLFYVHIPSGISDTTSVVVLHYYLFVTSGMALIANQDPLDTSTPLRQWQPRIQHEPNFSQAVSNIIVGVFTIDSTSLDLNNGDNYFNQWLGADDNFNEKDVDIWMAVRATEADAPDFERVYKGKTKGAVLSRESLSLTVYDTFSRLNQPALMGDSADEVIIQGTSTSYPNCDAAFINKVVPIHIGPYSRWRTKRQPDVTSFYVLDYQSLAQAFCSSIATVSTSNNRTWTLGRCQSSGFRTWTLPAPDIGVDVANPFYVRYVYSPTLFATFACAVGDRIKFVDTGVTFYARIAWVNFNYLGNPEIYLRLDSSSTATGGTPTITSYSDPCLVLVDSLGSEFQLAPGRDYTSATTTTSGGNKVVTITFVNNFEANLTAANAYPVAFTGTAIDPANCTLYYRLRLATTNANHADFLNTLLTNAGVTSLDSTTFAAANAALPVNYCASIPYYDEDAVGDYVHYVEDLMASALGILSFNTAGTIEYLLLGAPTSTDTSDENVLSEGSDSITIDYGDIVTQIVAYNSHNSAQTVINGQERPAGSYDSPSGNVTNLRAQYLNGFSNVYHFRHVLETITARLPQILASRSNRRATYQFSAAHKYLDGKLGQDVLLKSTCMLGTDTTRAVKIFSLTRSADIVSVIATDLEGVT